MFNFKIKTEDTMKRVDDAAKKAAFKNFGHAAASISKDVKSTLQTAADPSPPGKPPHTRKGALRRAIRYSADAKGAVIGPTESMIGQVGAAHEFGGSYKGTDFDERSYMHPALERNAPRFASDWQGSIGE